jgi:hypothetical protein
MLDLLVDLSDELELDRKLDFEKLILHYEEVFKDLDALE